MNRRSLGGLSRRCGPDARGALLGRARDFTLPSLRALAAAAAGPRLRALRWTSGLFLAGLVRGPARIPVEDVIGIAIDLGPGERWAGKSGMGR